MILSGRQIIEQIHEGGIIIDPFDTSLIGPNSCNLRLHDSLQRYTSNTLDMAKRNPIEDIHIPRGGFELVPGELYLGRTVEYTETNRFVPMIEGRSSAGRLGIFVHVTAGFGDIGFSGTWTLEIMAVKPVIIYPFVPICQIYFHTIDGDCDLYKSNKYQGQKKIVSSRFWKDITRIPQAAFFDEMEERFHHLLSEHEPVSSTIEPLRLVISIVDENERDTESLVPYVFNHTIDASGAFPRQAIIEFYSEIPRCLNTATIAIANSHIGKIQTSMKVK